MEMQNQVHEMILLEKLIVNEAVEQFPPISFMWRKSLTGAKASSLLRFLDHTQLDTNTL